MQDLKKISIIWGIVLLVAFGLLTYFGLKWKAKYDGYFDLEKKLVSVTKNYYESEHTYPTANNSVKITYEELKSNNLIDELTYNDDKCDGYVLVKNNGVIEYNAYIKCNNYTTKGYNK